ncbi:MAG: NAD(P)H-dependent oxidoreductase [Thermoguttaceae bacterium]|nr:NAD(P)H-dependent oxidoreductase [Thermoguttaceae bacterium]MDW8078654.1 NAD(P)H-dependent oxidoreductase [Thermoguttaceae bacterium]
MLAENCPFTWKREARTSPNGTWQGGKIALFPSGRPLKQVRWVVTGRVLAALALALPLLFEPCQAQQSQPPTAVAPDALASQASKPLVLVVYYSRSGNTEKMAEAVAEGARQAGGVAVLVRPVTEVTKEELAAADAIALGCPTYFANIPGVMKDQMDLWNWKWRVDFTDKIGGAFATGGGQMGGKEHTMVSLLLFMLANRMIVAGPLFEDETGEDIWGEPGAGAMTGPIDPGISSAELDSARRLGWRLADLAKRFRGKATVQR